MVHACWIYRTLVCALWFCDVGHQAIYQDLDFLAHIGVASYSYYADPSKAYDASSKIEFDQAQAITCPSTGLRETTGLL